MRATLWYQVRRGTAPGRRSIEETLQGMSSEAYWYDFLVDSLEPRETDEPLFNALPLPAGTSVRPEIIRHYFRNGIYPYDRRYDIRSYYREKMKLQIELVKLQNWVKETGQKLVLVFEGRDAAGKGSTIKRLMENLNPRGARVIALEKPTDLERGQWYFQRYVDHLPTSGEIVFFDRSWYNRAGVERVMNFCTEAEYWEFTRQAPIFEKMLVSSGISLLKLYLSVSREEQARRFRAREENPLKQWKLSPIDREAQQKWDAYTSAKEATFQLTDSEEAPWIIIKAEDKLRARLNTMRHVLQRFDYTGKDRSLDLEPDPLIVAPARLVFAEAEDPGEP
jgi:polyphosphate kinase 2